MKNYIFSIFILFFTFDLSGKSVAQILETIPDEHREDLNLLFKMIFIEQDGAYTIFGDKPVSQTGAFIFSSWETTLKGKNGYIGSLWNTWQKYKNLFHIKKYAISGEKFEIKKSNLVAFHIFVINKEAFINSINEHKSLFEQVLNKRINPEKFLQNIVNSKISFWESINFNEMLLGILLGYGTHNAYHFNKRNLHFFDRFYPKKMALESKKINLEFFGEERHPMMIVNPVQFAADLSHPETIKLDKKYRELRTKISSIYSNGNFLEKTLSQLTSD